MFLWKQEAKKKEVTRGNGEVTDTVISVSIALINCVHSITNIQVCKSVEVRTQCRMRNTYSKLLGGPFGYQPEVWGFKFMLHTINETVIL